MPSVLTHVLAAGLALLLGAGSTPAWAQRVPTKTRGTVTTPYVVFHPGTAREMTWFLGEKGPLATGEALTAQEVRDFLAALDGGAPLQAVAFVAGKLGRGQRLEPWEHQLWKDYLAHVGERAALVEAGRDDMRPTAEDRRDMALRVALGRLLPALADGLGEEFQPERILHAVVGSVVVYLGMWAVPEPISKTVALGVTVVMLVAFGAELLAHVVREWKALVAETLTARTFAEVKGAGERFGRAMGEDGARVLFVLASLALGKNLHGMLRRLPRAPPGAPALEAALPGGMRLRLPPSPPAGAEASAMVDGARVASISVVGDRFIVTMAAATGAGAGTSLSQPGGGASPAAACAPAPSSKRLAANMEAVGVRRPPWHGCAPHCRSECRVSRARPHRPAPLWR